MDAYNRGYNEGIKLVNAEDVVGSYLGNVQIIKQSDDLATEPGVLVASTASPTNTTTK